MKEVLIIQAEIKQYREPFFVRLHEELQRDDILIRVVHSAPPRSETAKADSVSLSADVGIEVPGSWWFNNRILYQAAAFRLLSADLVIVEQAHKYVNNWLLLPAARLGLKRVAYWGLGANLQTDRLPVSEWLKRRTLGWPSWWFAYTRGTAEYLSSAGVDKTRITTVQNAVDTNQLRTDIKSITDVQAAELRHRLSIPLGARVGLYIGMLDRVKRLDWLLDAATRIKAAVGDFHLLIGGGGPERPTVEQFCSAHAWAHYIGPLFGREKALHCRISDIFLIPGRVGLAILDAFAGGLPVCATALPNHGPEIEYLEEGSNGIRTAADVRAYTSAIIAVLNNRPLLEALKAGATRSGHRYTIEMMVANFAEGVRQWAGNPQ
jgi:glycosyltransferase involved in cell wall biosynthesis